ncbi:hypothetical protein GCM10011416_07100 [Polaribacter pacificus]|uniref:DUF4270 domain-containing protein n=1 Tax=Polaribacter pacificus TaxID=1775173 RepID=A0A917MCA6_9FLAO|nr:DUF4270 family protein [Polaribacter pacificus]GGG92714.1 hypothetical protein GCM10011416_07100 [Polaribacter pacificus]
MYKDITKKGIYFGIVIFSLIGVISCEKDFQDVNSSVINNTKYTTKDTVLEVVITNKAIQSVRADGLEIGGALGQYLLGIYADSRYEKLEASIVSQLQIISDEEILVDKTYGADTTVVTTIDTVFLKLPYQATLKDANSGTADFELDSILGDKTKAFTLNIYESGTYLSRLNPQNPSKIYSYQSDYNYQKIPGELNATPNYQFIPKATDTAFFLNRRLSDGSVYKKDTITLTQNNPFARIPLSKTKIKQLFLDKLNSPEFASQDAFNNYFKGVYLEATGNEGTMLSLGFINSDQTLVPSIELYYTNTVIKGGTQVVDTIERNRSFPLAGFTNSAYKMEQKVYPADKNIIIQGTAGNMAELKLFGDDNNNNGVSDQIEDMRAKNYLVNDATLTLYVNQDIVQHDTITTPFSMFLYKENGAKSPSQIKDVYSEGLFVFGGNLELADDKRPDKYVFKITDYVSDLLNGTINYNPTLNLKVSNPTDFPETITDTIVKVYSWNPKAITLLNHDKNANGDRRAQLKISYSIKK